MARRIEQGSILGFVLVGAVLTALLLGGVYLVRHAAPGQDGDANVATTDTATTGEMTPGDTSENASDDTTTEKTDKSDTTTKEDSTSDDSLKSALDSQADTSKTDTDAASDDESDDTTETGALPKTGPGDTVVTILGATLLAGAGFAYVQSRRLL